ncbi:hypothetical protein K466DRAFT_664353, partial [Polyporus arcularius HHB13444]
KAEDLGLPGRRRNGDGGVAGDQVEAGPAFRLNAFSSPRQNPPCPSVPPGAISYTQNASSPAASFRTSSGPPPLTPSSSVPLPEAEPLHLPGSSVGHWTQTACSSTVSASCRLQLLRPPPPLAPTQPSTTSCTRNATSPCATAKRRLGPELRRTWNNLKPLNVLLTSSARHTAKEWALVWARIP